jgi:hypothetical protein
MAVKRYVAYRITCTVTGLSYIGITSMTQERRWWKHTSEARIGRDRKLYRAMREYGVEAFEMVPLATSLTREGRWSVERDLIAQWGAFENGYNELPGVPQSAGDPGVPEFFSGPSRPPIPEWQKERMRALFTGRVDSPETVERKRKAQQARAANGGNDFLKGYQHSAESCAKRSIARGGTGAISYAGVVYPSLRLAAVAAGVSKATMRTWVRRHGAVLPRMIRGVGRSPARVA